MVQLNYCLKRHSVSATWPAAWSPFFFTNPGAVREASPDDLIRPRSTLQLSGSIPANRSDATDAGIFGLIPERSIIIAVFKHQDANFIPSLCSRSIMASASLGQAGSIKCAAARRYHDSNSLIQPLLHFLQTTLTNRAAKRCGSGRALISASRR